MIQIPKLAKTGIINNIDKIAILGKKQSNCVFKDKYYQIYKRTKSRRIKKKQLKKSLFACIEDKAIQLKKGLYFASGVDYGSKSDITKLMITRIK